MALLFLFNCVSVVRQWRRGGIKHGSATIFSLSSARLIIPVWLATDLVCLCGLSLKRHEARDILQEEAPDGWS